MTNQLYRAVQRLLEGSPDHGARGEVEVRRFVEPDGRYSYVINQYSGSGGWASPSTYSLAVANLAAECLALICGATLLACEECDAEEDWS